MTTAAAPTKGRPGPAGPPAPGATRRRRRRAVVAILVVLLLLGAGAARGWWTDRGRDVRAGTTAVGMDGLAAEYGIRVSLIAVTAAGGLVEFRYQVVDPDKADQLVHDAELAPALVNEDTGATLVMANPPHHHGGDLELGGTYFFLLANARNALHAGDAVTLVIKDVRVEHLVAQG